MSQPISLSYFHGNLMWCVYLSVDEDAFEGNVASGVQIRVSL